MKRINRNINRNKNNNVVYAKVTRGYIFWTKINNSY